MDGIHSVHVAIPLKCGRRRHIDVVVVIVDDVVVVVVIVPFGKDKLIATKQCLTKHCYDL